MFLLPRLVGLRRYISSLVCFDVRHRVYSETRPVVVLELRDFNFFFRSFHLVDRVLSHDNEDEQRDGSLNSRLMELPVSKRDETQEEKIERRPQYGCQIWPKKEFRLWVCWNCLLKKLEIMYLCGMKFIWSSINYHSTVSGFLRYRGSNFFQDSGLHS